MEGLTADIPAPVRSECHSFWIRQRVRTACQLPSAGYKKMQLHLSINPKNFISIISPLQNLVRLGSKALLKLNSSAKTQARVANQKHWNINQHYYLLALLNAL